MGAYPGELRAYLLNERQRRVSNDLLVPGLVFGEPFAIVMPLQLTEEFEELWAEIRSNRHDWYPRFDSRF
jgi:hypothetical protein